MLTLFLRLPAGVVFSAAVAGITALLCSAVVAAAAATDEVVPRYENTVCPFAAVVPARCGRAFLPENRAAAGAGGSGVVSIPVVQLGGDDSGKMPAVVLGGGGPGGGLFLDKAEGAAFWDLYRRQAMGDDGRLILIDQRGAGLSRPLLSCPAEKPLIRALLPQALPMKAESARWRQVLLQCRDRLLREGVAVDAYSTAAAADDVEDIRRLLGIARWQLIGFSYGTRLALEVLRRHPNGVAGAVLDSPLPVDAVQLPPFYPFSAVIETISRDCAAQAHCRRHGNTADNIASALQQVSLAPLTVSTRHNGDHYDIALPPHRLLGLLHTGSYTRTGAAALPFFSRQLAAGETDNENARYFARQYLEFHLDDGWATMLNWVINCQEKRPRLPAPTSGVQAFERAFWGEYLGICAALWPADGGDDGAAGSAVLPITLTEKPVLIISGMYDPATPMAWGQALARRLPRAQLVLVANSHTPSIDTPCVQQAMRSFFRAPSVRITDECANETLTFY